MRLLRDYALIGALLLGVLVAVCLAPAQAQQGLPGRVNVASATATTNTLIGVTASILGIQWRGTGTDGSIRISDSSGVERIVIFTPASEASAYVAFPGEGVFVSGRSHLSLTNVDGVSVIYR